MRTAYRRRTRGAGRILATACAGISLLGAPVPGNAATLFGLVDTGELFASTNAGASWDLRSTLPVRDAVALTAGGSSSQLFLASESGSFYRSSNAGTTWSWVSTVPASDVTALLSYSGHLLLSTRAGSLYASLDEGGSFSPVGVISASDLVSIARQQSANFALTRTGTVYRSSDDGVSWVASGNVTTSDAVEIASFNSQLHVLTATGALARSADGGANWTFVSTLSQVGMTGLLSTSSELVATTAGGEVAATPNGNAWTWRGVIGQLTVKAIADDTPTTTGIDAVAPAIASRFLGAWPNPARAEAKLTFDLPGVAVTSVSLYDVQGRLIAQPLAGARLPGGRSTHAWRPANLPRGAYILRAEWDGQSESRPFVWLGGP